MAETRARTLQKKVGIRQQTRRRAFVRQEVFDWEEDDEINEVHLQTTFTSTCTRFNFTFLLSL
jgi:hypothetical protein